MRRNDGRDDHSSHLHFILDFRYSHCVNQLHQIAKFNCAKKNEFIKKGLDLYYAKHSYMAEFPADVAIAEKRTGGNPNIIHRKEFIPVVKADKTTPVATAKGKFIRYAMKPAILIYLLHQQVQHRGVDGLSRYRLAHQYYRESCLNRITTLAFWCRVLQLYLHHLHHHRPHQHRQRRPPLITNTNATRATSARTG